MNKSGRLKSQSMSNKPKQMRVLFKKRNNPRQGLIQHLTNKNSTQNISQIQFGQNSKQIIKRYVRSRMKTQQTRRQDTTHHPLIHYEALERKSRPASRLRLSESQKQLKQINKIMKSFDREEGKQTKQQLNQQKDFIKANRTRHKSFEQISDGIDQMIENRLSECNHYKNLNEWKKQQEINKLIEAIRTMKSQNPQEEGEIQKRISLLQRLLAEKYAQSDILKSKYLQKLTHSSSKIRHHTYTHNSLNQTINRNDTEDKKYQSVVKKSANQQSFNKPFRQAYDIYKHQNKYFNADRHKQPLPRSSYNRQYLVYRGLPKFQAKKPDDNNCFKTAHSNKSIQSSYMQNYTKKRAQRINIKQLDAYKDKFKNLPIVFNQKIKEEVARRLTDYIRQKKTNIPDIHNTPKSQAMIKYQSEAKRQFIKTDSFSPAKIKHQNLYNLKYSFKKHLHI